MSIGSSKIWHRKRIVYMSCGSCYFFEHWVLLETNVTNVFLSTYLNQRNPSWAGLIRHQSKNECDFIWIQLPYWNTHICILVRCFARILFQSTTPAFGQSKVIYELDSYHIVLWFGRGTMFWSKRRVMFCWVLSLYRSRLAQFFRRKKYFFGPKYCTQEQSFVLSFVFRRVLRHKPVAVPIVCCFLWHFYVFLSFSCAAICKCIFCLGQSVAEQRSNFQWRCSL